MIYEPFVRLVDGRFSLKWPNGERPLTRREVLMWRLFQRTPRP